MHGWNALGIRASQAHGRWPRMYLNIDNPDFVAHKQDPLQARTLPVAWVDAMVNWFRRFESSRPSALKPVIVHGYEDRTVGYRHDLPVLARVYPQSQLHIVPPARRI